MAGAADEVGLYLFPIKKGVVSVYNAPLHQKRRAPRDKWGCKGGSCHRFISPSCFCGDDIDSGSSQIRLYLPGLPGKTTAGKSAYARFESLYAPTEITPDAVEGIVSVVSGTGRRKRVEGFKIRPEGSQKS